jgi:hypothetical protein
MKTINIGDFLSTVQMRQAIALYQQERSGAFVDRLVEQVILPNMAQINRKLGQENDPRYLAYAVQYALLQSERA